MDQLLKARLNGLCALFFLNGLALSTWVSRTPDIRDGLGASISEMGLIIMGMSVGSLVGVLSGSPLTAKFGARRVTLVALTLIALATATIGTGSALKSSLVVTLGLALFGLGMGASEISLNVEGGDVERKLGKSALPMMHGFFSLGTVVGALAGMGLTALRFPVSIHMYLVSAIIVLVLAVAIRPMPPEIGMISATQQSEDRRCGKLTELLRDPRLLLIGFVILALSLAEGSANDWLPILMVDGHGFSAALGSGIYALFALTMTLGRFVGTGLVDRFGRLPVLGASAAIGACGMALVAFVDNQLIAGAAVILWGLGASLGFPVALSEAGDSGPDSAARLSFTATVGYIAFLVGPPVLGFLGESYGLRSAIVVVLVTVVLAVVAICVLFGITPRSERSGRQGQDVSGPT